MNFEILDPKDDYIFKRIFGQDDIIFIDFVNSIFKDKNLKTVRSVIFVNSEIPKDIEDGKGSRLDVKAILDDGSHINIEVQVGYQKHYLKRTALYWSRIYSEQLKEGQKYDQLNRCVCINILAFNLFSDNRYHRTIGGLDIDTKDWVIPDFEIHFIELKKLPEKIYEHMTHLEKWITFLQKPEEHILEKLSMNEPIITKAKDTLYFISQNDTERQIYNARLKYQLDYNSQISDAREDGKVEGEKIKALSIAKKLKLQGISTQIIAESSGLSIEEIEKL